MLILINIISNTIILALEEHTQPYTVFIWLLGFKLQPLYLKNKCSPLLYHLPGP